MNANPSGSIHLEAKQEDGTPGKMSILQRKSLDTDWVERKVGEHPTEEVTEHRYETQQKPRGAESTRGGFGKQND